MNKYELLKDTSDMYLKSQELTEQLIKTHKDDLLIYFEVESEK